MCTSAYWPSSMPRELPFPNFYGPIRPHQTPSSPVSAAAAMSSPRGPIPPVSFPLNAAAAAAATSMHAMGITDPPHHHPYPLQHPPPHHQQTHPNFEAFLQKPGDVSSVDKQRFGYNYKLPWQHVEERFGAMSKLHHQGDEDEGADKPEDREGGKNLEERELEANSKLMSHCRILKIKGKKNVEFNRY